MTTSLLHAITAALLVSSPRMTAPPADPCALLTKAEAEAIIGKPIMPPTVGGSGECHYGEPGEADEIVVYPMPLGFKTKEEFHAFVVKDTDEMNARMKENLKSTGAKVKETTVDPVPGVGESAYYVDPSLIVFKRNRVLNIIAADRKRAVAVATKALPRFGP